MKIRVGTIFTRSTNYFRVNTVARESITRKFAFTRTPRPLTRLWPTKRGARPRGGRRGDPRPARTSRMRTTTPAADRTATDGTPLGLCLFQLLL